MDYLQKNIAIVGAGPAGMMAGIYACLGGAKVTIFEKNDRVGKKLAITGKGRCNVTNDCERDEFLKNVISNPKFLYASISNFSTEDTKSFFEGLGVELKTACLDYGCEIKNEKVLSIITKENKVKGVKASRGVYDFDRVIVATGGASYPQTGSDGDGYRFAQENGIEVTELIPSLVPLETYEDTSEIMGVSLKNVTLKIRDNNAQKIIFEEMGEMLFTHFGISGPLVLSASCHMEKIVKGKYTALIDFKPALDTKTLDLRILSDFSKQLNKDFQNALGMLLPSKIIPFVVEKSGILPTTKVNNITKEQRQALVSILKALPLEIKRFRPIKEAIVTRGGVSVKELVPSTMESKKVKGLYFAGEVIDVDAYTGGYNLQIAFSTGALAGTNAAQD